MSELIFDDPLPFDGKDKRVEQPDIFTDGLDIPEGIYFNLPYDDYRKGKGLSYSAMKDILTSPLKFWEKHINPKRKPEKETDAKEFGKLYHKYMLERDDFFNHYEILPSKSSFKELLVTTDDIKAFASKFEISTKGCKVKADYISSVRMFSEVPIWDEIVARAESTGKIIISGEDFEEVKQADERLRSYPEMADIFTGGYAEVSIFIKHDGVMYKARLDYITHDETFDPKTFSNSKEKPVDEVVKAEITYRLYNLQYLHYSELREEARKRLKSGKIKVFGDPSPEFLAKFKEGKNAKFSFVFQESAAPNEARKITLEKAYSKGASPNVYHTNAERMRDKAIAIYKNYSHKFSNKAWIGENASYVLTDEEIPSMLYQQY